MNPHQLAEKRMQLSEEYSRYSGELAQLNKTEADYYMANREKYKSDTAVKRAFEVTEEGQKTTTLKLKLKALEKQMSAIKTVIDVATQEAHGLY